MADAVVLDFETRSDADLKAVGSDKYAKARTTGVWCLAYAFMDAPGTVKVWRPGEPLPDDLIEHVADGGMVVAHNVRFEWCIWNQVLRRDDPRWPMLKPAQLDCTMARALRMNLPPDLFRAAKVLGVPIEKDAEGHRLMLQMAKRRKKTGDWWDDENKIERLIEYCRQDVRVEIELHKRLPPLTAHERRIFDLDFIINTRGVKVDLPTVALAKGAVADLTEAATAELAAITANHVTSVNQVEKLKAWALGRGEKLASLQKSDVADMIAKTRDDKVKRALQIRQEAGLNSVKKFAAMEHSTCPDGRARGLYQYHGASVTGRWGGRRIQPQNLLRPAYDQHVVDEILEYLGDAFGAEWIDFLFGSGIHAIASCCRAMLTCEDGHVLRAVDFSNIEGRVTAWLAGEESKINAFREFDRGEGPDLYKLAYANSFGVPVDRVTKDQRLIGKVQELALGFGGGLGAFASMARNYGLKVGPAGDLTEAQVEEIKQGWRDAHPNIVKFWRRLEMAALSAIRKPGDVYPAGPYIRYRYLKIAGVPFLLCKLPSQRTLSYPHARVDRETGQVVYFGVDRTSQLGWIKLWGGQLCENCLAADTPVLTCAGWKPLLEVTCDDLVWDGVEWVQHEGVVAQGEREVIDFSGVRVTPDHKILTESGWNDASNTDAETAAKYVADQGFDRTGVWASDGGLHGRFGWLEAVVECQMFLRGCSAESRNRDEEGAREELRVSNVGYDRACSQDARKHRASAIRGLEEHEGSLRAPFSSGVSQLRRTWHRGMRKVAKLREFLGRYVPYMATRVDVGAAGQRRGLLSGELHVAGPEVPGAKPADECSDRHARRRYDCGRCGRANRDQPQHSVLSPDGGLARRADVRHTGHQEPVYDLLNAGPRHRFVVLTHAGPVIVSNCVQATARDVQADAMIRLEEHGYPIVMHTHDEAVAETHESVGSLKQMEEIMAENPRWCPDLPIAVEGWQSRRYRK